jgi:hypothetical protein
MQCPRCQGDNDAGAREQVHEHLATVTMYREMGMRFWLEQAEADMGMLA